MRTVGHSTGQITHFPQPISFKEKKMMQGKYID